MDIHALLCVIGLVVSFSMVILISILSLRNGARRPYLALVFLEAGLYFFIPLSASRPAFALVLSFASAFYALPSLYLFMGEVAAKPCAWPLLHYIPALVTIPLGIGMSLAVSANGFHGGLPAAVYIIALQSGMSLQLVFYGRATLRLSSTIRNLAKSGGDTGSWSCRVAWTAITGYSLFLILGWISLGSELIGDLIGRRIIILPESGFLSSIVAVFIAWTLSLCVFWGMDYASQGLKDVKKYGGRLLDEDTAKAITCRFKELLNNESDLSSSKVTPRMLSKRLGVPYYIFSRVINEGEGKSVSDLINEYRIERAKELLESEPGSSILDIAFDVGFKSKSTFNSTFKSMTGLTPRSYRASGGAKTTPPEKA